MVLLTEPINVAAEVCQNRSEKLMVACYMLVKCRDMFKEAFGSQEMADAFIMDRLEQDIDPEDLQKVV